MRETSELNDIMSKCNQHTSTEHSTEILQKKKKHSAQNPMEHTLKLNTSRHRSSLNKSKGIKKTPDHNGLILGINSEKNHRKYTNS